MNPKCAKCGHPLTNESEIKASDAGPPGNKSDTTTVVCSNCGHLNQVNVGQIRIRSNPRGTGAHYASKITKFGPGHSLCLATLNAAKAQSFESGLGLNDVWHKIRQFCNDNGRRVPTKGGTVGRLSELQGLGLVTSARNEIELTDPETMSFRPSSVNRWFLTEAGIVGAN